MPSPAHEGLVEVVRDHPRLVAEMLGSLFGLHVPAFAEVRLEPEDLSQWQPTECRADVVVSLRGEAGEVVLATVVEVQRSCDLDKRFTWLLYIASLQARLRCDVVLVVIAPGQRVAKWCAEPISYGHPGLVLAPLVAGPMAIPVVTDPAEARKQPWLAALSAMAHWRDERRDAVFTAFVESLRAVNDERMTLYSDVVVAWLPEAARRHLEGLMATGTYEYQSEFVRRYYGQGFADGEAIGEANAILTVLATRGLDVSSAVRERIASCTDTAQLTAWLERAVTVARAEDLFG